MDPLRRQRTVLDECAAIETVVCLLNTLFLFSTTLEFVAVFFLGNKETCLSTDYSAVSSHIIPSNTYVRSTMRRGKPCVKSGE